MISMIPNRPQPYEDELSAIEAALASLETQVTSVNDTLSNLDISATQTNNTSVIFSGAAIYDQTLSSASLYIVADDKIVVSGTAVCRNTTDNAVEVTDFTMVNGDSDLTIYNNTERVKLRFASGSIQVFRDIGPDPIQVTLLFYTQPAMGTGIVGPSGPAGAGFTVEGWNSVTFGSGWSNFNTTNFHAVKYRSVEDMIQMRGTAGSSDWANQPTIFTLPVTHRPTRRIINMLPCAIDEICRVDVLETGEIQYQSGGNNSNWIVLDQIQFSL